jgi:uncharacterized protein YlxP (DUF503 family)
VIAPAEELVTDEAWIAAWRKACHKRGFLRRVLAKLRYHFRVSR